MCHYDRVCLNKLKPDQKECTGMCHCDRVCLNKLKPDQKECTGMCHCDRVCLEQTETRSEGVHRYVPL